MSCSINNVHPLTANQYNAVKFEGVGQTSSGSCFSCKGNITINGFIAQNNILQYQAVVPYSGSPGQAAAFKVSGSTGRATPMIMGLAETAVSAGETVNIIIAGIVPAKASGSCPIGTRVMTSNVQGRPIIENIANKNFESGSTSVCLGYTIAPTGSGGETLLWVQVM